MEKKNTQIDHLQQLLENQQILTKQTLDEKKQLELEFLEINKI
ncbi:DUF536 domain-containing protein [Lactococcus lactis]|nr:DUF536 domain-containing protein [Lactococcus lactis]MCT2920512.1 DUF536 domain-containing protein [Lactococcus lactis]